MIEAALIGPLVNLLQTAEFDIKKEAAWAISNATSGGTHEQIKYGPVSKHLYLLASPSLPVFISFMTFFVWAAGTW